MPLPLLGAIPLAIQIIGAITGAAGAAGPILDAGKGLIKMLAGDKAEEVAGKVIDSAKKIFGTDDPRAIELAIQKDQSALERYVADVNAETDRYRIEVDDRKSARERDVQVRGMNNGSNLRANLMVMAAFLYVIVATVFIFLSIDDLAKPGSVAVLTFLTTTMGNVVALLGMAFAFEFGSSRGSSDKSDQIAGMVNAIEKLKGAK